MNRIAPSVLAYEDRQVVIAWSSNPVIDFTFFHHNQSRKMIKIIDDLLRDQELEDEEQGGCNSEI